MNSNFLRLLAVTLTIFAAFSMTPAHAVYNCYTCDFEGHIGKCQLGTSCCPQTNNNCPMSTSYSCTGGPQCPTTGAGGLGLVAQATSGSSPMSNGFSAACVSGTQYSCTVETVIIDYGSASCPSSPPSSALPGQATMPYCGGRSTATSYTVPLSSPCLVASAGIPIASSPQYSITSTSTSPVTDNICGYGSGGSGWYASFLAITINPSSTSGGNTGGLTGSAISAICQVYSFVNVIVFVLALTLMILGGALYAGAQILPGATRGQVQAYAMGLVLGGVAGAIIAMLAPYVLSVVYNAPTGTILGICSAA